MTTAQGGRPHDADSRASGLDDAGTAALPADPAPSPLSAPRLALRRTAGAARRGAAVPASAVPTSPPLGRTSVPPVVPPQRAQPTVSGPIPAPAGRSVPPPSVPPPPVDVPSAPFPASSPARDGTPSGGTPSGGTPSPPSVPARPVTPPATPSGAPALLVRARRWAARPTTRRSLVGAACLVQAGIVVSALAYWISGPSSPDPGATVAPVAWVGVVHDVGAAGVNLRSAPEVFPATSRNTAHRGAQLEIVCAQTGDVVGRGPARTSTWLKTADGLYVSLLYVHVAGKQNIATCADDRRLPLISLADPGSSPGGDVLASGGGARRTSIGTGSASAGNGGNASSGNAGNSGGPAVEPNTDDDSSAGGAGDDDHTSHTSPGGGTPTSEPTTPTPTGTTTTPAPPTETSVETPSDTVSPGSLTYEHAPLDVDPDLVPLG